MGFSTKLRLIKEKFEQQKNDVLNLSGETMYYNWGNVRYHKHPEFTGATQIIDKKYVDDHVGSGITASTIYHGESPTTITVGGLDAGSSIDGWTLERIIENMVYEYMHFQINSYDIQTVPRTVEMGYYVSALITAKPKWNSDYDDHFSANTITVYKADGTVGKDGLNLSDNNGTNAEFNFIDYTFTADNNTLQKTRSWKITGADAADGQITEATYTTTAIQPWFWGEFESTADPGDERPDVTQSGVAQDLINNHTKYKLVENSNGTISFNFGHENDTTYYLWFAIPTSAAPKTMWWQTELNSNTIPDSFMPAPDTATIEDPSENHNWTDIDYAFYVTRVQAQVGYIEFRS